MLKQKFLCPMKKKKSGKRIFSELTSRNDEKPAGTIQQSATRVALNEELSAACCDSFITEEDVNEVSETVSAQSAPSEFEVYLSS